MTPERPTAIDESIDRRGAALLALSHAIHADPEIGFEEVRSVRRVADYLQDAGLDAAVGVYGLDTALESSVGDGGPTIAFLAEYDALADIGHACGHNVICAASVGAYVAVADAMRVHGIPGRVVLLGTPAEENGTGKELMARAGAFADIDAALMIHPYGGRDIVHAEFLGLREVEIDFHGHSSHAAAAPEYAHNALDAAVAAYQGISALRQHMVDGDRVHGVFTRGGDSPNVVPDRAGLHYYVRSGTVEQLERLSRRVEEIARGAAMMTETTVELRWDACPPCLPVRTNDPLGERFIHWMGERGRAVRMTDPDAASAPRGSTDAGNVSVRLPLIHPMVGITPGGSIHSEEFVAAAASERADQTILDAAASLAHTAWEYLTDAQLRADVATAFGAPDLPKAGPVE